MQENRFSDTTASSPAALSCDWFISALGQTLEETFEFCSAKSVKRLKMFRICGPKLSICGLLLSIWGVLQLGIMAILFHFQSVAFIEDIKVNETEGMGAAEFKEELDKAYANTAKNCLITTLCYVFTLALSAHQFWINSKAGRSSSSAPPSPSNNYRNFQNET